MRVHCAYCGSGSLEVELDLFSCLRCGEHTDGFGNAVPSSPKFYAPSFQELKAAGERQ